jgi:hypothetical protein
MGGGGGSGYVNTDKCIDGSLFPMTPASCAATANATGVELGGAGYDFAGDFGTKGCYMYTSGAYANKAYFGTGGTDEAMTGPMTGASPPKMRFTCDNPRPAVVFGQTVSGRGSPESVPGWVVVTTEPPACQHPLTYKAQVYDSEDCALGSEVDLLENVVWPGPYM